MFLDLTERRAATLRAETIFHVIAAFVSRVARELRIRYDIERLAGYDDAMLRDLGLARTEIEPALRHGRSFRDAFQATAP